MVVKLSTKMDIGVQVGPAPEVGTDFDWWDGWGVFFVGAGVIVIIEGLIRLGMPSYRSKWAWSMLWGTIFLALGLGGLASPAWYALPLVGIAVLILKDAFARST